ncbi:MAG: thiaminase II [Sarcina sp.]
MKFTDELFKNVEGIWNDYLEHPFIKEIIDGTLDIDKFEEYLIQDYLYLKEYAKAFAIGVVKANTMEEMKFFYGAVKGTMEDENEYHTQFLIDKGYNLSEIELNRYPSRANSSYTSYMLSVALKGGTAKITAAILPCTWSYCYIGQHIISHYYSKIEGNPYRGWIELYGSKEYKEFTDEWITYINKLAEKLSEDEKVELIRIFVESSKYEMDFWNMSYDFKKADTLVNI